MERYMAVMASLDRKKLSLLMGLFVFLMCVPSAWAIGGYPVKGRIVDKLSREPVAYATVALYDQPGVGASTDSAGVFCIEGVQPGIHRLAVSCIGYKSWFIRHFA